MQRYLKRAIALAAAIVWPLDAALSSDEWVVHRNLRYGFSISYPRSAFAIEKISEAGDGQIFYAAALDARLLVGAIPNHDGYSPTSYAEYIASHSYSGYTISYRKIGSSWLALSGRDEKRIFYEKVQFSCGGRLLSSFAMIYPISSSAQVNPVIERIENSFRSARNCTSAPVSALAVPAPGANAPSRKMPSVTKGRSASSAPLAHGSRHQKKAQVPKHRSDPRRLARRKFTRGREVIVVLRRKTPPYDLRFVRGYVATNRVKSFD
jgi:hypothetical protein